MAMAELLVSKERRVSSKRGDWANIGILAKKPFLPNKKDQHFWGGRNGL